MPLSPQNGCSSRLSVSGGEADIAANDALDQANADTAAKNANVDLKELNVSSDKGEASFSVSMNIEDHTVYKKTQNIHNLVASGEGSAYDGEKISISAGTEEECYASAYESDGYQAFAGHVDTESVSVREDDLYEDGEIRELLMQSIAEDLIAEGMDSGKNNESSSKNVHSSLCFTNEEICYSMPLHTESYDDFVKACDEKAEKLHQKDSNLRNPLLDKEETTGDDEQRPIDTIYNATFSSHFSLPHATDVTFSSNYRPVAGRLLSSRSGKERYSYMEEEKFYLQRNRDEIYGYGPKFVGDRFQDCSFGISRGSFMNHAWKREGLGPVSQIT